MIYFITHVIPDMPNSPVKIGYTRDAHRLGTRLASLRVASPWELQVLGKFAHAAQATEKDLHRALSKDHLRGEWFARSGTVERVLDLAQQTPHLDAGELQDWIARELPNPRQARIARSRRGLSRSERKRRARERLAAQIERGEVKIFRSES